MITRPARAAAAALALAALASASPALALKVGTWNLWQYPTSLFSTRQPNMRIVMGGLDPDVMIVQELGSLAGRDSFLNVLEAAHPERVWKASTYFASTESAIYWDSLRVDVQGVQSFADGGPRDVLFGVVKPRGYLSNAAWFRLFSIHLKAGNTAGDASTRAVECSGIRTTINNQSTAVVGPNFLIGGDSNFYAATEAGYVTLTESQADNDGRCRDPLLMPGTWHLNSGYALYDTQCPCNSTCLAGFSGGGLDDRFDWIMSSYTMQDGLGLDLVPAPSGYITYGNDGQHYNNDINGGGFNNAVGITIANALHDASDHIPVAVIVRLPAKVSAASTLDFGAVLVGATAQQALAVANGATPPADALTYGLAAPAGFTAPGGTFEAAAGAGPNSHTLGMDTATRGARSGALTVSSDDPDSAAKSVLLSGTVLSHAVPSLDSLAVVQTSFLEFGDHLPAEFTDQEVRVHDQGHDALQARLSVSAADITGGDGRFSIVGGFTPTLIGGTGHTWSVRFDAGGATADSVYEATLALTTADEALPGAAAQPTLTVALRARPLSSSAGVDGRTALRFERPRPNPFTHAVRFTFELAAEAPASLAVYDLGGRRVALLAEGLAAPGRHEVAWDGRDEGGARVPAGLYFARFQTPGLARTTRLVLLP